MTTEADLAPDIETASVGYSRRFAGQTGEWLLSVQTDTVFRFLPHETKGLRVLEVGGGHCQLTKQLLGKGMDVWVHGSNKDALTRVSELQASYPDRLHIFSSSMYEFPFEDRSFDIVIGLRLLAHVHDPQTLLREWVRVAKCRVLFDYPPLESFNVFYPLLFRIKKLLEGNTRTFEIYRTSVLQNCLRRLGCKAMRPERQYLLPMVIHRMLKNVALSRLLEGLFRRCGLTGIAGSPAVLCAERLTDDNHNT